MSLAVAAVGAVVAALLELTLVPYLQIGGVQADLVLVLAVAWTLVAGLEAGLVWAFVGGLMLDVLAARPLGLTAFVLLVCVGAAAALGRVLEPTRLAAPAITTSIVAVLYAVLLLVIYSAIRGPVPVADPLAAVLPRGVFDTVLGGIVGAIALRFRSRRAVDRERLDW
jgi:rod shape-determining protein MreD